MTNVTTQKINTGRYSIGEKLLVVAHVVTVPGRNGSAPHFDTCTHILPYWKKKDYGIAHRRFEYLELEVIEHHKVTSEYDEENKKNCDGYILKSADGRIFYNQYPIASYGQVSDRGNRIFTESIPEKDWDSAFKREKEKGIPSQYVLIDEMANESSMDRRDKQEHLNDINKKPEDYNLPAMAHIDSHHQLLLRELSNHKEYGNKWKLERVVIYKGKSNTTGQPFEITRIRSALK